jgi:hypothetical protein
MPVKRRLLAFLELNRTEYRELSVKTSVELGQVVYKYFTKTLVPRWIYIFNI